MAECQGSVAARNTVMRLCAFVAPEEKHKAEELWIENYRH